MAIVVLWPSFHYQISRSKSDLNLNMYLNLYLNLYSDYFLKTNSYIDTEEAAILARARYIE